MYLAVINDLLDLCLFAIGELEVGKVLGQAVCESLYRHNRVLADQIPAAGESHRIGDIFIYCLRQICYCWCAVTL